MKKGVKKGLVTKERIGVIAGGISAEREISLKSGKAVFNVLKERGYDVVFIDAGRDLCDSLKCEKVNIAFLSLHGGWGEDGSVQGMLEVMGISYTGSGVLASALAMDKVVSKEIFRQNGLNVTPYLVLNRYSFIRDDISKMLSISSPWVVKPAGEGSSIGVNIVETTGELERAIDEAFQYGERVLVEEFIKGKEINIGILGCKVLGGVEVRPKGRFYDYYAKYTPGLTEYILPPELAKETYDNAKGIAFIAHTSLSCKGATRVDLLIGGEDTIYALEVNTIPGMTETSLLPKIAALAGYSFSSLIDEILSDAIL